MNTSLTALTAAVAAAFLALGAQAADVANDPAAAASASLTRDEAKDLQTQSEAQYKARKKVAEANEALGKADCKTELDGAARRACEKSAKASAKVDKADAKTIRKMEDKAIKDSTQAAPAATRPAP